jgi:hypothetical protein
MNENKEVEKVLKRAKDILTPKHMSGFDVTYEIIGYARPRIETITAYTKEDAETQMVSKLEEWERLGKIKGYRIISVEPNSV